MSARVRYVQRRGLGLGQARDWLENRVEEVERRAKQLARPHGSMPRHIHSEVDGLVGKVLLVHPAASYVIRGTRPHPIEPKRRGGTLVFDWPKGGLHPAFFKRVNHPGYEGDDFLSEALWSTR